MAVWALPGLVWGLGRKIEELLKLQEATRAALDDFDTRLRALEDRAMRLELSQGHLITEAKAAASSASTVVAAGIITEAVTRLTRAEIRLESVERGRLPPPSGG